MLYVLPLRLLSPSFREHGHRKPIGAYHHALTFQLDLYQWSEMIFGGFWDTERRWGAKLAGRQGAGGHRDDGIGARGLTRRFPGNTAPSCLGPAVQPRSSQRMRI
jgi:hypothetical protein